MVGDATTFDYQKDLDIVFAFASLLHLNKQEVKIVLDKVHEALKPGGVFYISLKYMPRYARQIKEDRFGRRVFYFYNADLIRELASPKYAVAETYRETIGHTEWLEISLRK